VSGVATSDVLAAPADSAGRFTEQVSADELMFGNVFEKPIRDSLPWGTSVAQKAI
jgi:hypothetical protein